MQTQNHFERQARKHLEETDTPFRDMLCDGYTFVGGVFKAGSLTVRLITNELYSEVQKSDHKVLTGAINLDVDFQNKALMRELDNRAILEARNRELSEPTVA